MNLSSSRFTAIGAACLGLVFLTPGHAEPSHSNDRQHGRHGRHTRGREVLETLRNRLPEMARVNGLESRALESLLHRDRELWVDDESRLIYVCEGLVAEEGQAASTADALAEGSTAVPTSADAFKLHSLPGASRVIYLDFNGHVTSGTSWNTSKTSGADIVSAPFDLDGNPTGWSATELERIKRIWQRVAEDYMPFAVDVTTEDPGVEALRRSGSTDTNFGLRVVISPSSSWYGNAGGVAYLGSFQWSSDTPAFVFSDKLGPNSEKYIAEAAAHETGHTLGLSHDGKTDGTGYYGGHGNWAPIMGVGYYKTVTQWSKGEYALANNLEDDMAKIPNYGAPAAADDYANDLSTTTSLTGPSVAMVGVIENRSDMDVFRFNTGAGALSFAAGGTAPESNLDVKVELLSATGVVLASSDPAGVSASVSLNAAAGTYFLRVQGVGAGDPATVGYSDYGSVGEYQVTGSIVAAPASQAPTAKVTANVTSGVGPLTVVFSSAGSTDADGSIASTSWNFGDGTTSTAANPTKIYSSAGNYTAVLTVVDNTGLAASASVSITVTPAANQAPLAKLAASATYGPAPLAITFSSAGSSDADGSITAYYWTFGDGTTSTAANPSKTYSTAGTHVAKLTVTDDRGGTATASTTITVSSVPNTSLAVDSFTLTTQSSASASVATARVKIVNGTGAPVPGVVVKIQWGGLVSGTSNATTDANGLAIVSSRRVRSSGTITASLAGITPPSGYTFNAGLYPAPGTRSVTITR